ncbi:MULTISPECIES: alpha/beta hydrolase [unclassified Streptomyces]|uniref:alpha/beta fold hydrolase n=1 Tax=Streptomyces sp. SID8381 TaxID=2690361 RepID=UPI0004858EA2|nr:MULTISPECIES: alpha/beta hydrolase [unclassified Streptomyces]
MRTADGVAVDALYEPGAAGERVAAGHPGDPSGTSDVDRAFDHVFVIAHGFTGDLDRPHVRRAARAFARHGAVVTFSFRGHGASGGRSTVGDREVLDLAAAVAWARGFGHARVTTVGFSMGGSVVLRHAALYGGPGGEAGGALYGGPGREAGGAGEAATAETDATGATAETGATDATDATDAAGRAEAREGASATTEAARAGAREEAAGSPGADARTDAVISVSAPARWYYRGTAPMRRLHWLVMRPTGRLVGRWGLRTRIHHREWDPVPLSPVAAAARIAPVPLLIVHGDRDAYFPLDHPRMLAAAAGDHGELWLEPGMGHAENAAPDPLLDRMARWAIAQAG